MALTRKYSDYTSEITGPDCWCGVIVWVSPEQEADGHAVGLHNSTMPGRGGPYPPRAKRVTVRHNAEPGFAHLVARYKTSRTPGEAKLLGRGSSRTKRLRVDLDDKIIEGPAPDGMQWFRVSRGTNISVVRAEVIMLKTAVEAGSFDLPGIRANHGSVNAGTLPNFGNAPPGSLLFWDYRYRWEWGNALWYVDYLFRVCPERDEYGTVGSWNETLYVQKGIWAVTEVPAFTPDASLPINLWPLSGQVRHMRQWVPGYEWQRVAGENTVVPAPEESRRTLPEADFSNLNALVVW